MLYTIGPKAIINELLERGGVDKTRGGMVYTHLEFAQMALTKMRFMVRVPVPGLADIMEMDAAIYGVVNCSPDASGDPPTHCLHGCDEVRLNERAAIVDLPKVD